MLKAIFGKGAFNIFKKIFRPEIEKVPLNYVPVLRGDVEIQEVREDARAAPEVQPSRHVRGERRVLAPQEGVREPGIRLLQLLQRESHLLLNGALDRRSLRSVFVARRHARPSETPALRGCRPRLAEPVDCISTGRRAPSWRSDDGPLRAPSWTPAACRACG